MAKTDKKKPPAESKRAAAVAQKRMKVKPVKRKAVKLKAAKLKPAKLKLGGKKKLALATPVAPLTPTLSTPALSEAAPSAAVLDRLWAVVNSRRNADPAISHSARLLSRGTAKVAQKFGEEAVECLIEAASGTHAGLVAESADVLYHLLVMWVNADLHPGEVWAELQRREGVSGIAEKAARAKAMPLARRVGTRKIP